MSAKPNLYAVTTENKSAPQLAHEAVKDYRERLGAAVGERTDHRGWLPEIVLAFMAAEVEKPAAKLTQRFIDTGRY